VVLFGELSQTSQMQLCPGQHPLGLISGVSGIGVVTGSALLSSLGPDHCTDSFTLFSRGKHFGFDVGVNVACPGCDNRKKPAAGGKGLQGQ
jgi:hypothetical protein